MKKIVRSLFVVLLFILFSYFVNDYYTNKSSDKIIDESPEEIIASKKVVKSEDLKIEREESEAAKEPLITQKCYTIDEFIESGIGENVQDWFASWGAPRTNILSMEQEVHPYSNYEQSALESMVALRDSDAAYALGMNLVSQALTGEKVSPQISAAVNDNLPVTYLAQIDKEKLERGREILFDSAVYGNIYAFVDLAFSYSSEREALKAAGVILSEEQNKKFELETNKFGSIPNILIPDLDKNFFQGPDIGNSKATQEILKNQIENIISNFSEARETKGFQPYRAAARSVYFEPFEICPSQ